VNGRYAVPAEPRDPFLGVGLWRARELTVSLMLYVLGAVGLAVAWSGSAGEPDWREDGKWLVIATAAVSLAGLGLLFWLVVGRIRIAAAERVVRAGLLDRSAARRSSPAPPLAGALVTAARMRRYHRSSCLLMNGKTPVPVAGDRADLRACGVCGS